MKFLIPVVFNGEIEVDVPVRVPVKCRQALAEAIALARILATTDNPDAPEDVACEAYAAAFALSEQTAGHHWDITNVEGVSGSWGVVISDAGTISSARTRSRCRNHDERGYP